MSKAPELAKYRAPAVSEKLGAAETFLAVIRGQTAQAALDEAENQPGAGARMKELAGRIAAAESEVEKLKEAHKLALEIDRRTDVIERTKLRAQQLTAFEDHARARDAAAAEICAAAATMATAFQRYSSETLMMLGVRPVGTSIPTMAMGPNGQYGSAIGNLERLIGVSCWLSARPDDTGQKYVLPFAAAPGMHSTDPADYPQPIAAFREAQAAILAEIKAQVLRIDSEDLMTAKTEKAAA